MNDADYIKKVMEENKLKEEAYEKALNDAIEEEENKLRIYKCRKCSRIIREEIEKVKVKKVTFKCPRCNSKNCFEEVTEEQAVNVEKEEKKLNKEKKAKEMKEKKILERAKEAKQYIKTEIMELLEDLVQNVKDGKITIDRFAVLFNSISFTIIKSRKNELDLDWGDYRRVISGLAEPHLKYFNVVSDYQELIDTYNEDKRNLPIDQDEIYKKYEAKYQGDKYAKERSELGQRVEGYITEDEERRRTEIEELEKKREDALRNAGKYQKGESKSANEDFANMLKKQIK